MLAEQWTHQFFQLFSHVERQDFGRVAQTIHHVGDAAVFQRFGGGFPTVLDQFGGIAFVDAVFNHLLEAQNRTRLQHTAQNGLLTHQVRLDFSHERRFQTACAVTASTSRPCLGDVPAFFFWIILRVYCQQCWNTETTLVLFTYFRAWALWCNHNNRQVFTDLHAFFNDVEAVGVTQASAFFHQRHNSTNHSAVLLVWCQVTNQISCWDQFFVSADNETVFGSVFPGLTLLGDGCFTQSVGNVQARVTHVQTLVQALCATTNDDDFLAFQEVRFRGELVTIHKTTATQLIQLLTKVQCVEIVITHLDVLVVLAGW